MTSDTPRYLTDPPPRPIDLSRPRRVHVIGIGGAGMSAIARVLTQQGHRVAGSDLAGGPALAPLRELGVVATVGHAAHNLGAAEIVSRSTSIPDHNPEVEAALSNGLLVHRRDELLSAISQQKATVSVGGTHGKTTTSSMLTLVLLHAGLDPAFIIGGQVAGLDTGANWSAGDHLIVEADESDGTFLRLETAAAIVTSVEPDHLNYYGSHDNFVDAFARFLRQTPGPRVLSVDDSSARALHVSLKANADSEASDSAILTYGTDPSAAYQIVRYEGTRNGCTFDVRRYGETWASATLAKPGVHNARNATAALVMAVQLGVDLNTAVAGLATYAGVGRRWEERGSISGITFVDDYAHLPSEVGLTLDAARAGNWGRVVCVFQPHRYSRTGELGRTFGHSFSQADHVIVTGIYPSGEKPIDGVTGRIVFDAIRAADPGLSISYVESLDDVVTTLAETLTDGDLCLTLGAGDLTRVPDQVLTMLADANDR